MSTVRFLAGVETTLPQDAYDRVQQRASAIGGLAACVRLHLTRYMRLLDRQVLDLSPADLAVLLRCVRPGLWIEPELARDYLLRRIEDDTTLDPIGADLPQLHGKLARASDTEMMAVIDRVEETIGALRGQKTKASRLSPARVADGARRNPARACRRSGATPLDDPAVRAWYRAWDHGGVVDQPGAGGGHAPDMAAPDEAGSATADREGEAGGPAGPDEP